MSRLCATRDATNKDNVRKPTIPAGINRPPPSETISHIIQAPNQPNNSLRSIYKFFFVYFHHHCHRPGVVFFKLSLVTRQHWGACGRAISTWQEMTQLFGRGGGTPWLQAVCDITFADKGEAKMAKEGRSWYRQNKGGSSLGVEKAALFMVSGQGKNINSSHHAYLQPYLDFSLRLCTLSIDK